MEINYLSYNYYQSVNCTNNIYLLKQTDIFIPRGCNKEESPSYLLTICIDGFLHTTYHHYHHYTVTDIDRIIMTNGETQDNFPCTA